MKLDELHVRDLRPRAPRHGYTIARRDVRVRSVKIHFPAAAGGQDDVVAAQCLHRAGGFIEHVKTDRTIAAHMAEFPEGDDVHGHVFFKNIDPRRTLDRREQGALDLSSGDIPRMQDTPFAVSPFAAKVEFAATVGQRSLIKVHAELNQLADARRTIAHDRSHHALVAQARAGIERIATCNSKESSLLVTLAMPPCAQAVFDSARAPLVMIATLPVADAFRAKLNPAMPLPITM